MLADRLKKSIEEILQLSTLEFELWAGYMLFEHEESKKPMGKPNVPMPRRRRR
jgi:hypothetical protein|tara:strand:- start:390 stop:548 length:159 start_codon:yes stop_codon:yes gene_type:complete